MVLSIAELYIYTIDFQGLTFKYATQIANAFYVSAEGEGGWAGVMACGI